MSAGPSVSAGTRTWPRTLIAVGMLVAVLILNTRLSPYFLAGDNLSVVMSSLLEIGLMAIPMTFLITAGHIDLSVASILALSAAIYASMLNAGFPAALAVLGCLLAGVLAGALNGLLVTRLGLNSIVVTIGTLALYRGIAAVILTDETLTGFPTEVVGWDGAYVGATYITWSHVLFVGAFLVAAVVLNRMRFGRKVTFTGGAPGVALFSGISVPRVTMLLFVFSGGAAALAAVLFVSRLQAVRNDVGAGLELAVITAVLIGGTDIRGGRGTMLGTLAAVLLVGAVRSGLGLANVPDQARIAVIGGLLVLAVLTSTLLDMAETRRARRRSLKGATTLPLDETSPGAVPAKVSQ